MNKKYLVPSIFFIIFIILGVLGIIMISNQDDELSSEIIFVDTEGYVAVGANGYSSLTLYYFNVEDFEEDFNDTLMLLDDEGKTIDQLSYTSQVVDTFDKFTLKTMTIAIRMDEMNTFNIKQISFGEDVIYNVGNIVLEKTDSNSEVIEQGYNITISSFTHNEASENYQRYAVEFDNQSNHSITINQVIAGNVETINQELATNQKMEYSVDCSNYFDATSVIVGGRLEYQYNGVIYSIILDPMYYLDSMTEAQMYAYIMSR